ncbi:hypothetical protein Scipio_00065 [Acinetobacter phage Scipio]|nr:hypothetical protein Scipio_00065 [Acinetobacter phage Scipio]
MNLIEQLGGYENVSRHFNRHDYNPDVKIFIGEWFGFYSMLKLKGELLEYRRQNEIYELGDLVVFKKEYSKDSVIHKIDSLRAGTKCLRHATDEEIKKGCRL